MYNNFFNPQIMLSSKSYKISECFFDLSLNDSGLVIYTVCLIFMFVVVGGSTVMYNAVDVFFWLNYHRYSAIWQCMGFPGGFPRNEDEFKKSLIKKYIKEHEEEFKQQIEEKKTNGIVIGIIVLVVTFLAANMIVEYAAQEFGPEGLDSEEFIQRTGDFRTDCFITEADLYEYSVEYDEEEQEYIIEIDEKYDSDIDPDRSSFDEQDEDIKKFLYKSKPPTYDY
jgi:hypothetical protein